MSHCSTLILSLIITNTISESCTNTTTDTCFIQRSTTWNESIGDILCDDSYPICIVICDGSDASCSSLISTAIKCPQNGQKCIIQCLSAYSCQSTKILISNTLETHIIIDGYGAGGSMLITDDQTNNDNNNTNKLYINVTSDFYRSTIDSHQNGLSMINVNCDLANICSKNKVYGKYVDKSVTYSCNGPNADCRRSHIHCPMNQDSECNIYCSYCQNTNIYTKHSIIDINLECINDEISCFGSSIYCDYDIPNKNDNDYYVDIIYDKSSSKWMYQSEICQHHQNLLNIQKDDINDETLQNEKKTYDLINGRSFLQYFIAAFLLILCICCIALLFCYFMQRNLNFQHKLQRNLAKHQEKQEIVESYNADNDVSYQLEIEQLDDDDDDFLNLTVSNINVNNHLDQYRITPTPTPTFDNIQNRD